MSFCGTGLRFDFSPSDSHASTTQVKTLLEDCGYNWTMFVHDDDTGIVEVAALKIGYVPLEDNKHEVDGLRAVVGRHVTITYFHVRPVKELTYLAAQRK